MKRLELLKASLSEEKNVDTVVATTKKADAKFLVRTKRDLEDKMEDLKEQLESRLSSSQALDKSVVESLFAQISTTKQNLSLYESFEKEYID